ncbi:MAG: hypothetical protein OHK0048_12470 [Rhodoferax sp.]
MRDASAPAVRDIVLVGGGHSHVGVLRSWAMKPLPGVRLTLVCTDVHTPYSGMLPGYVAGHYDFEQVHIDLARLAAASGARLYQDTVVGLDRAQQRVLCRDHPPLHYDWVSINTGSTPSLSGVPGAQQYAVPVKPIAGFHQHWLALLQRVRTHPGGTLRLVVVGAGAGGVELLLAMQWRLRAELAQRGKNPDDVQCHLVSASARILPTHNPRVQARFDVELARRNVRVHLAAQVVEVQNQRLRCADGRCIGFDALVWVTQAQGAPWLAQTGLALDANGFVRVRDTLQSETDPRVLAAGDVAALAPYVEKAGVFAVRMGPVLAHNLRALALNQTLRRYRPQRRWLALISTGERYAVASRGALALWGHWVWRWKDWIDRRFMRRFSDWPVLPEGVPSASPLALDGDEAAQLAAAQAMRCGGCGAKVGARVLERALADLPVLRRDDVVVGLGSPDDAAVVRVPPGQMLVQSVDFFRAFIDDPYLLGRIAANHALGDVFAMGARAHTALAIVTLPPGLQGQVQDSLRQLMTGAVEVLNAADCALVGGHSSEGQELAVGFAVQGLVALDGSGLMRKAGLQPGDALILTKPLGTGTLLAAHARGRAKGRWVYGALDAMQVSQQAAARVLQAHGARACTDVTGFGLMGHLLEMLRASGVDAQLVLEAVPALDGALDCLADGVVSSLHRENRFFLDALVLEPDAPDHDPRRTLLVDPQTAGGLLAGVPAEQAQSCVAALRAAGYVQTAIVGRVVARPPGQATARVACAAGLPTS